MKKGGFSAAGIAAVIGVFCFCGDSGTNTPVEAVTTVPIASLRFDSVAMPGWNETTYLTGDSTNVFPAIDGGALTFIKYGMGAFSKQHLEKGGATADLVIIDFVTVQAAKNMYTITKNKGVGSAWGSYSPDNVVLEKTEFYRNVYARINKYYFELQFYIDNGDSVSALAAADAVYNKYLTLIK
jgi:hypothetical protein